MRSLPSPEDVAVFSVISFIFWALSLLSLSPCLPFAAHIHFLVLESVEEDSFGVMRGYSIDGKWLRVFVVGTGDIVALSQNKSILLITASWLGEVLHEVLNGGIFHGWAVQKCEVLCFFFGKIVLSGRMTNSLDGVRIWFMTVGISSFYLRIFVVFGLREDNLAYAWSFFDPFSTSILLLSWVFRMLWALNLILLTVLSGVLSVVWEDVLEDDVSGLEDGRKFHFVPCIEQLYLFFILMDLLINDLEIFFRNCNMPIYPFIIHQKHQQSSTENHDPKSPQMHFLLFYFLLTEYYISYSLNVRYSYGRSRQEHPPILRPNHQESDQFRKLFSLY